MIEVEDSVWIPSSRPSVFRFASRPENMPLWNPAVLQSRVLGELRTGVKVVQLIRLAGRTFETVYELTAYDPSHRIAYTSLSGPVDVRGEMNFRAQRNGTLVHWSVRGDGSGLLPVADSMLAALGHRQMHRCLENLKGAFANLGAVEVAVRPSKRRQGIRQGRMAS